MAINQGGQLGPFQVLQLNNMEPSWLDALKKAYNFLSPNQLNEDLLALDQQVRRAHEAGYLNPPIERFWAWTRLLPVDKIKVIIVGNEPSPEFMSSGHAFHPQNLDNGSESVQTIFDQLEEEFGDNLQFQNYSLEGWMRQGVVLVNVRTSRNCYPNPKYNQDGHNTWLPIMGTLFSYIYETQPHVIFILVGAVARNELRSVLEMKANSENRVILTHHPSYGDQEFDERFFTFSEGLRESNRLLLEAGDEETIDWTRPN